MQETADHLLYPNPASRMVSEEHLQYFVFFGKILGKVCCLCWIHLFATCSRGFCTGCYIPFYDKFLVELNQLDHIENEYYAI